MAGRRASGCAGGGGRERLDGVGTRDGGDGDGVAGIRVGWERAQWQLRINVDSGVTERGGCVVSAVGVVMW